MSDSLTMRAMFEAGAHFGHQTRYWNPKMAVYIYGARHKIHIIDLEKSMPMLRDAINFAASIVAKKGKVLFVGTKMAARDSIKEEAVRCGMPYVSYRWLGGTLTNYKTIRQSVKRLKALEIQRDKAEFTNLSKKEALNLVRKIEKMECNLQGLKDMHGLPDALLVVDVGYEKIAVSEANKLRIPVIGIVDTNSLLQGVSCVVPANDDSAAAIKLYMRSIADAIIEVKSSLPIEQVVAEKQRLKRAEHKGASAISRTKKKVVMRSGTQTVNSSVVADESTANVNVVVDGSSSDTQVTEQ